MKLEDYAKLPIKFIEAQMEVKARDDSNACTVIGLSIAGNVNYGIADDACNRAGRKRGKGMKLKEHMHAFFLAGLNVERVPLYYSRNASKYTPITIGRKLRAGRYICYTRTHCFAVVDGKVMDWTNGRKHRVLAAFRITKLEG